MADKRKNGSARSRATRILCIVLVVLMLLGSASTIILFMIAGMTSVSAAGYDEPIMSIGIQYGDSAVSGFRTYSDTGYKIMSQIPDGDRSAEEIGEITHKTVIVAPHANLAPSGTGFAVSDSGVTVGGYRLELEEEYDSYSAVMDVIAKLHTKCAEKGYVLFPYYNGKYRVRAGAFTDTASADKARSEVESLTGMTAAAVSPAETAVTVLTPSAEIIFEYDCGAAKYLSLTPAGAGDVFMRTDNNYIYEGSFMYKRSGSSLTVINMIGLETYIEGVLPYEISSSWHLEAQKAFAVAARSYAVGNKGKHYKTYGFDLCSGTNCQVYKGAGGVNDTVKLAVSATAGKVLTYNDKIATLYYSSSTGGCTVSAEDCWGGTTAPYLTAVETAWERYADYNNGLWTAEVSPKDLLDTLVSKGYKELSGSIASAEILELAENSTYVKSIKFTDANGKSITITGTDKVRTTLSKYLKSANFTVGQGSVEYTVTKVEPTKERVPYSPLDMTSFNLISAIGNLLSGLKDSPKVITSAGRDSVANTTGYVITADNAIGNGGEINMGFISEIETRTFTAESTDSFVFAGKGWGHGVGLSQYGTKDLAEFGYTYDEILSAYVPKAELENITDLG